jgi:hypothetical protein
LNTVSQLISKYPCFRVFNFHILPSDILVSEALARYQKEAQNLSIYLTRLEDDTRLNTRLKCYDARRTKPLGDRAPSQVVIRSKSNEFWRLEQVIADMGILLRRSPVLGAADKDGALSNLEKELSALNTYQGNRKLASEVIEESFDLHSDGGTFLGV